jgi:ribosomal protein S18 acetylase RimI-like enzyme
MIEKSLTLNDGRAIKIRQLSSEDDQDLSEMFREMSEETIKRVKIPSEEELYQKFRFPDYFIGVVLEHDSKIVGYGEVMKDPEKEDGELQIVINKDFQGVGLGTALMIMLLKEATDQGIRRINLEVSSDNRIAIHLFRKFGFQQEEDVERLGFSSETLHFTKTLNK